MHSVVFLIFSAVVGIFAQQQQFQPGINNVAPSGGGFTGQGFVNPGGITGLQPGNIQGVQQGVGLNMQTMGQFGTAGGVPGRPGGFVGQQFVPQTFMMGRPLIGSDTTLQTPGQFVTGGGSFVGSQLGGLGTDGVGTSNDLFGLGFDMFNTAGSFLSPSSPIDLLMRRVTQNPNNYRYATCVFNDTWSPVRGRVDFRQFLIGEGSQQVTVRIQLSGLPQAVGELDRGIHVHEFGDIGSGCARVGPHFNPNQTPHGSRRNFAFLRHVGNLGNIRQSPEGLVSTQFADQVISLEGVNNVVGRAIAIKFERDDEGMGGTRDSQVNGNTHNPIACCTIGRTTSRNWYNPMSVTDIQNMAATGIMPYLTFAENQVMTGTNQNFPVNTNINTNPNVNMNMNQFGTGTFMPGATSGQTFNFGAQGKK